MVMPVIMTKMRFAVGLRGGRRYDSIMTDPRVFAKVVLKICAKKSAD
jgi:hypothetical protein